MSFYNFTAITEKINSIQTKNGKNLLREEREEKDGTIFDQIFKVTVYHWLPLAVRVNLCVTTEPR